MPKPNSLAVLESQATAARDDGGDDDPPGPLAVGDVVELASVPPGRLRLHVGQQGTVLVVGLVFGLVSIEFGRREGAHLVQIHPRHLQLVSRPAPVGASGG